MENKNRLAFQKSNYILMIAGITALIVGFVLMTMDKEEYGFGSLGLTVGPIIVVIGFIIEIFAIIHKPKSKE